MPESEDGGRKVLAGTIEEDPQAEDEAVELEQQQQYDEEVADEAQETEQSESQVSTERSQEESTSLDNNELEKKLNENNIKGKKRKSASKKSEKEDQSQTMPLFRSKGASEIAYETYLQELHQWKEKQAHLEQEKKVLERKQQHKRTIQKEMEASSSDSDLDECINPKPNYFRNESLEYVYKAACKRFNVVPFSQFIYQLKRPVIVMTNLSLNEVDLTTMCVAISKHENITMIDFSGNRMNIHGLRNLITVLANLNKLESLNISQNKLGSKAAKLIANYIDNLKTLRYLNLSDNGFIEKDSDYLSCLLQPETLESLRYLDISNNTFGSYGGEIFAAMLATNSTLEVLNLSWCDIRMTGAVALGLSLKDNGTLDNLNISHNGFGDIGAKAIADALKINQSLSVLNLCANRIFVDGAIALGEMLGVNEFLKELNLDQNCLTCEGAEQILGKLKNNENSKLQRIDMKNVSMTYKTAAAVLPSIQQPLLLRCDSVLLKPGRIKNQLDIPTNSEGRTLLQKLEASATNVASVYIKNQRVEILRIAKKVAGYGKNKINFTDEEIRAIFRAMPIDIDNNELEELMEMIPRNEEGLYDIRSILDLGEPTLGNLVTSH